MGADSGAEPGATRHRSASLVAGDGRIVTQSGLFMQEWDAASQNSEIVTGHVLLRGKPVSGVGIRVGNYPLRTLTDSSGKFSYRVDGGDVVLHIEQIGEIFELPVTITLQYADKKTADVLVPVTEPIVELRFPLTGALRSAEISKDDPLLAIIVKN